jgi:hypothetical protein
MLLAILILKCLLKEINCNIIFQVSQLVFVLGEVTNDILTKKLDNSLIDFIHDQTTTQHKSQLWQNLHRGRITSSQFGEVLHAKTSPSLTQKILQARYALQIKNTKDYVG